MQNKYYNMILLTKKIFLISLFLLSIFLSSCSSGKLSTNKVTYQSVRTTFAQPDNEHPIPEDAEIVVAYTISDLGALTVIVFNRTDEIMTIDQTKSFFVNSNGVSNSYYDPTIHTTSTTSSSSTTTGEAINIGAVAGAFGVGGPIGTLLNGVTVGGADTYGSSTTHIVQVKDLPQVSLAPKSQAAMSKTFQISGMGVNSNISDTQIDLTKKDSYCTFSVCISYSIDEEKSYKKIVTNFYANSKVVVPVSNNKSINNALRNVYAVKPDALSEPFFIINFNDNRYKVKNSVYIHGFLYDFQ